MSGGFKCRYCGHTHPEYRDACLHCEAKGGLVPVAFQTSSQGTLQPRPVSDAIIERVLTTRVPGGSEVWHVIDGGGLRLDDGHRAIVRRVLEAYEKARHEGVG